MRKPVAMKSAALIAAALALSLTGAAHAAPKAVEAKAAKPAVRFIYANPTALIASGAVVPPGFETFYVSGIPSNVAGGTEAQTADVLNKLGLVLKANGYDFADVANVKVYLVADPAKDGKMDFAGMNSAFKKVFGTDAEPNKPSRVTVQVAGLALAGALVEIELVAAKAPAK